MDDEEGMVCGRKGQPHCDGWQSILHTGWWSSFELSMAMRDGMEVDEDKINKRRMSGQDDDNKSDLDRNWVTGPTTLNKRLELAREQEEEEKRVLRDGGWGWSCLNNNNLLSGECLSGLSVFLSVESRSISRKLVTSLLGQRRANNDGWIDGRHDQTDS